LISLLKGFDSVLLANAKLKVPQI